MANVTITGNYVNFDDPFCTGLRTITYDQVNVNNGGTFYINSDVGLAGKNPQSFGNVSINAGTWIVDGTTVRSFYFTGSSGALPTVGTTLTGLTSNVTGEIIYTGHYKSFNFTSGEIKTRSLSGPMVPNERFAAGNFTGFLSGVEKTGWLFINQVSPNTSTAIWTTYGLSTINISGDWYILGTGNGQTGQTFTHFIDEYVPVVWVEQSSGLGVYDKYLNIGRYVGLSSLNHPSVTKVNGHWFLMDTGTRTMTFPNFSGQCPGSGCIVKVPNIQWACSNTGAWTATGGGITQNPMYTLTSNNYGGNIFINKATMTSRYLNFTHCDIVDIQSVGMHRLFNFGDIFNYVKIIDVGLGTWTGSSLGQCVLTNIVVPLLISGCDLPIDFPDASSYASAHDFSSLATGDFYDTNFYFPSFRNSASNGNIRINYGSNQTYTNCNFHGIPFYLSACLNFKILNCGFSFAITGSGLDGSQSPINPTFMAVPISLAGTSDNILISGYYPICPIPPSRQTAWQGSRIKFINMGSPSNPVNFYNIASGLCNALNASITSDIRMQRLYVKNTASANINAKVFIQNSNEPTSVILQNIYDFGTGDNFTVWQAVLGGALPKNSIIRGNYFSGLWQPHNAYQYPTLGTSCLDTFTTVSGVHKGWLTLAFQPYSIGNVPYSGSGFAISNGALYFSMSGNYFDYTWPYYIKGYTGFYSGAGYTTSTNNTGIFVYYDIDNSGVGFSNIWKDISGLHLETVDPYFGFKPKFRLVNRVNGLPYSQQIPSFNVTGKTNFDLITGALYPEDANLTSLIIDGLITGSEVRVYDANTSSELGGVESIDSSRFTYPYLWEGTDTPINIAIMSLGYVPIRYENQNLGRNGLSLYVQQKYDRVYENP